MSPRTAQMTMTSRGIRIGLATMPAQRAEVTQDATRLQAGLLSKPRSPDWYVGLAMWVCACGFAVMAFAGWLPGGGL